MKDLILGFCRCLRKHAKERDVVTPTSEDIISNHASSSWQLYVMLLILPPLIGCLTSKNMIRGQAPKYLTALSLEQLMDLEVISVSKKIEDISETAGAVYVITPEDIRRLGVTNIPDALRSVPGLEVAHLDASQWAITSRGFNGPFANKLLVLIDGRSVYTPLFSGVHWDSQNVLLEDIERIEVIRGPGAALWGANAVNGVINILTKSAKNTQGGLAAGGVGSEERGFGRARYGGALGRNAWFRVYANYFKRDKFVDEHGAAAADDWHILQRGFRLDWQAASKNEITVQADLSDGAFGHSLMLATLDSLHRGSVDTESDARCAYLLSRWKRAVGDKSDMTLQLYYDWTDRATELFKEKRKTVDADFNHRFGLSDRQEIIWGLGYRFTTDDIQNAEGFVFDPLKRDIHLYSAFIQDEITLTGNILSVRLASKFERSSFSGLEIQPNVRLLWTPSEGQTVWGALSRAVRTPSRAERDLMWTVRTYPANAFFPGSPRASAVLIGNPDFDSESLTAYEVGYRVRPNEHFAIDLATYYNLYGDLRSTESGAAILVDATPPYLKIPFWAANNMDAETYGFELVTDWQPFRRCRLRSTYSFMRMLVEYGDEGTNLLQESEALVSPRHQFSLSSFLDLSPHLELDARLRYVDELPTFVDSYLTMDLRIGMKLAPNLQFSVVGQNLLDDRHLEFIPLIRKYFDSPYLPKNLPQEQRPALFDIQSTEVQRGVYATFAWRW